MTLTMCRAGSLLVRARALATALFGAALILTESHPAFALDPTKAITQYLHDVWQTEQGLPQNSLQTVMQTQDGYLWLGSQEGLVRFDGVRFTVFDTRNTPELSSNYVRCLLEDRAGRLWIGTYGGGLVRHEGGRFTRFTSKEGLPHEQVRSLYEDGRGRLWVGTRGAGLVRLEGDRLVREPGTEALNARRVQGFAEDREGGLWIATDAGLGRLKDGAFAVLTRKDGLASDDVVALRMDQEGTLWIATDKGLNRFLDGRLTTFTTKEGLSNNNVYSLLVDRAGSVWVGTYGGGLNRLRDGQFSVFTTKDGLSNDTIASMHEDREGACSSSAPFRCRSAPK